MPACIAFPGTKAAIPVCRIHKESVMLERNTVWKKAEELRSGDVIVTLTEAGIPFADRVNEVRHVTSGKVHIDVNGYTGTHIYDLGEKVRVAGGAK